MLSAWAWPRRSPTCSYLSSAASKWVIAWSCRPSSMVGMAIAHSVAASPRTSPSRVHFGNACPASSSASVSCPTPVVRGGQPQQHVRLAVVVARIGRHDLPASSRVLDPVLELVGRVEVAPDQHGQPPCVLGQVGCRGIADRGDQVVPLGGDPRHSRRPRRRTRAPPGRNRSTVGSWPGRTGTPRPPRRPARRGRSRAAAARASVAGFVAAGSAAANSFIGSSIWYRSGATSSSRHTLCRSSSSMSGLGDVAVDQCRRARHVEVPVRAAWPSRRNMSRCWGVRAAGTTPAPRRLPHHRCPRTTARSPPAGGPGVPAATWSCRRNSAAATRIGIGR